MIQVVLERLLSALQIQAWNRIKGIDQERGMQVMGREEKALFSIAHAEAAGGWNGKEIARHNTLRKLAMNADL